MPLDAAVELAVNDCIQENILSDFLCRNKAEVIAMSIFEYNPKKEEKMLRRAEFEGGKEATILALTGTLFKLSIPEETIISELTTTYNLPLYQAQKFVQYYKTNKEPKEISPEKAKEIIMHNFNYFP